MITAVYLVLTLVTLACADLRPIDSTTSEQRSVFDRVKSLILSSDREPVKPLAESDENWFWINAQKLNPLLDAYEYSRWYRYKTRTHS